MRSVYFLERRLNKARIMHLSSLANQSGLYNVTTNFQDAEVILASDSNGDEILDFLIKKKKMSLQTIRSKSFPKFVGMSWFFTCIKEKSLVPISTNELVPSYAETTSCTVLGEKRTAIDKVFESQIPNKIKIQESASKSVAKYACQMAAALNHKNKKFCDALELLELHAMYRGDQNADARALAFRRGSASLKSCGKEILDAKDLINLQYIGQTYSSKAGHCKKVILEILSEGYSEEVEDVIHSEFFQTMKRFCGIFGVGPVTARKWYYDLHLRTIEDVKVSKLNLTQDQQYGLQHYEDLNTPVTIDEANYVLHLVENTCKDINKNLSVTITGGFRRGKSEGHDIDLLICQPSCVKMKVLNKILDHLQEHFIYTDKKTTFTEENVHTYSKHTTMDHFEKCFSIFKFKNEWLKPVSDVAKPWKAIRVDFVVIPEKQFAFALLGWTGTKHFEREIRRYARAEKQIVLTSHGMHSLETKEPILASSEREIFDKLDLIYREPSERCF